MKNFILILQLVILVFGAACTNVLAQEPSPLPHGPMTRLDFVNAKSLPVDKNGEIGDAADYSERYDMLRMALDLRVDPSDSTISGAVQMVFGSDHDGLSEFVFDLIYRLNVDGIDHASGPLTFSHLADSVEVNLPTTLPRGTVDSLVVRFSGRPTSPVYNRGLMFRTHRPLPEVPQEQLVPIIANLSQPGYAQSWWPCKDRPDDKFRMAMDLTVPDNLVGVSNGNLINQFSPEPGWTTFQWREVHPIASYLVSVAISDYILLSNECLTSSGSNVPLRNWVFPADVEDGIVEFAPLCDMMEFCESIYGPYPFVGEKYGHAEFLWPGAMEHQTVTSIGSGSLDGLGIHAWLLVHELGHQWFGDSLTPADWADIWLNEGFATYTEALWFEHTQGRDAYDTYLANSRHEQAWIDEGPVYDPVPIFPGRVIYDKGAWILHVLRGRMGDTAFFNLVADWTQGVDRELGYVGTEEFVSRVNFWAAEDLSDLLWPYLTENTLPLTRMDYTVGPGVAGENTRLQVSLTQMQTRIFNNTYPLVVTTVAGPTILEIDLTDRSASASFELGAEITQVELDPEQTVLWNPAVGAAPQTGLTVAYPNPSAGNYVVFQYWLAKPSQLKMRFYDVMGRQVASRDLGAEETGMQEWGWDVTGDNGERIPSGVYWAALFVNGERSVTKFSVIR